MYDYPMKKSDYPKGIFLSNYIRWDSIKNNQTTVSFGFRAQKQRRTYDYYHRAGFSHYYEIHDYLRYKKYGYIKVRDHLNRDIRMGYISRQEAHKSYQEFLKIPYNFEDFFSWLGVNSTGAEWLLRHKFPQNKFKQKIKITHNLFPSEYTNAILPKQNYLQFYKGIHIGGNKKSYD